MNYDKVWEVMSNLEEAFNKIATIEFMVEELNEAVNQGDTDKITEVSAALTAYLPVYTSHYEKASLRAWNNTVLEVKKDQQYSSASPEDGSIDLYTKSYEEIKESLMELESLGVKC